MRVTVIGAGLAGCEASFQLAERGIDVALAGDLARAVGAEHLAYYDAIAPIVSADSIDWTKVFKQSRWGKGAPGEAASEDLDATALGDEAYVNCPFDKAQYEAFVAAVV